MTEKIELTQQELDDIKDDAVFKQLTTLGLKELKINFSDHIKSSQTFRDKVTRISVYQIIQWFLIAGTLTAVFWKK